MESIFVLIPSYRDAECGPTLRDLYAKAAHPERIFAGVCLQNAPEDDAPLALPQRFAEQIRLDRVDAALSEGVGWARNRAQRLYDGEDYYLSIDSHSRFSPGWDEALIGELAACDAEKPLLSGHPAGYTPPDHLQSQLHTIVQRVGLFGARGSLRVTGEELDRTPPAPLHGAFVACGAIFARASLLQEVPHDPYVYFDQEEITLSARLYTHGWDVFHPTTQHLYHYYTIGAMRSKRPLHWEDNREWGRFQERAIARYRHLLGMEASDDPEVLKDLDAYGLGSKRSLEAFERFAGLDFANQIATERALRCLFIEGLERYVDQPGGKLRVGELDALPDVEPAPEPAPAVPATNPAAVVQSAENEPEIAPDPAFFRVADDAPPGVLVVHDYLSLAACRRICRYADRIAGKPLGVTDPTRSTASEIVEMQHSGRVTQYVNIDGLSAELLSLFLDVYCRRVAPFYGVGFEWFERPQILRYPPGGLYDSHTDSENWDTEANTWIRTQDRDYSVVLYLNEEFEGGELEFKNFGYKLQPRAGTLVAFPSDHRYEHAALPTQSGTRYAIVSWAAAWGTERKQSHPSPGSLMVYQRRDEAPEGQAG